MFAQCLANVCYFKYNNRGGIEQIKIAYPLDLDATLHFYVSALHSITLFYLIDLQNSFILFYVLKMQSFVAVMWTLSFRAQGENKVVMGWDRLEDQVHASKALHDLFEYNIYLKRLTFSHKDTFINLYNVNSQCPQEQIWRIISHHITRRWVASQCIRPYFVKPSVPHYLSWIWRARKTYVDVVLHVFCGNTGYGKSTFEH